MRASHALTLKLGSAPSTARRWHPRASSCHLLASAHGLMVRVWDTRTGKTLSSFTHQVPSPNRSTFTSSSCFFPPQSAVNEVHWSPFKGSNEAEELVTSAVQDARLLFWNTLQVRCRCHTFPRCHTFAGAVTSAGAGPRRILQLHDL